MKEHLAIMHAAILCMLPALTHALPITLVSQSDNWDYNFGSSLGGGGGDNSFATFTAGYTGALNGNGPFGNSSSGVPAYNIYWNANQALYLQTTVDLTGSVVDSAFLNLAVDNGASVFVNGSKVFGASAGGFTTIWEYSTSIATSPFIDGINTISVIANDYGGLTYFDMQMTADVSPTPPTQNVPEPSVAVLLGLGLAGVGIMRRRRYKA